MKKSLQNFKSRAKQAFLVAGAGSSAMVLSGGAFAIDDTAVTAAYTAANTSVGNATTGLIALIALVVGISTVIALLKRG